MSIQRVWSSLAGFDTFNVVAGFACGADAAGDCARAFARALAECAACGLPSPQIVRSRIWARGASLRSIASDARLKALDGERRAASASFIAPERMSDGVDVMIDLVAMPSGASKLVREYEPRIAPPMFVALGDLVFLSGNTDVSATFDEQLERICANIAKSLAVAGTNWDNIVQVDAFVSRSLDMPQARGMMSACFPCAISMTTVEGYSAPEKLVEIEVTANRLTD